MAIKINSQTKGGASMSKEEQLKLILETPELWIKNFIKIVDKKGNVIPFNLNDQQKDFMQKKGKQNIILKARQLRLQHSNLCSCFISRLH